MRRSSIPIARQTADYISLVDPPFQHRQWERDACIPFALGAVRAYYEPEFVWNPRELDAEVGRKPGMGAMIPTYVGALLRQNYRVEYMRQLPFREEAALSLADLNTLHRPFGGPPITRKQQRKGIESMQYMLDMGVTPVHRQPNFHSLYATLASGHLISTDVFNRSGTLHHVVVNGLGLDGPEGNYDCFTLRTLDGNWPALPSWFGPQRNPLPRQMLSALIIRPQ